MLGYFGNNDCHHVALFYAIQYRDSNRVKRRFYLIARFYAELCGAR